MSDLIGQTIGNYQIEALLGAGGMGQVFRARQTYIDRPAAIKVMHEALALDPTFQARFRQEAKAIADLEHPNIVKVYEFGEQNGRFYLALELLTDGSLRALLRHYAQTQQPWSLALALDLMRQAADGLAYAHTHGMIHRDIKPDNMLLRRVPDSATSAEQWTLKLTDFGLVKMAEDSVATSSGQAMGTPAYMSPEQFTGGVDHRSDIYSLGVVIYEVSTGHLPFGVKTMSEAMHKHLSEPPPPPRNVRSDLPAALEQIILRCLAKKPDARFASAAELARALRDVASANEPLLTQTTVMPAPTPPVLTPPPTPAPQQRTVIQPPTPGAAPTGIASSPGPSALPRVQILDQHGQVVQVVAIGGAGLTIGRLASNTVQLDDVAISRHHAQIDWDGNQVLVTDVGSSNGSFLAGQRLADQTATAWPWREMLKLGPFWLRLEPPKSAASAPTDQLLNTLLGGSSSATPTRIMATQPSPVSSSRISVLLEEDQQRLTPGQLTVINVALANLGHKVDWLTLSVEGLPKEWARVPDQPIQLNPGTQATATLTVNVPRVPNSKAGGYDVTVRARSRNNPAESGAAQARWTVQPFSASSMAIEPEIARGRQQAIYQVTLSNAGNAPATYRLSASDNERALGYRFGQEQVPLDNGQSATTELIVRGRRRWVGSPQPRAFDIQARAEGGESPPSAKAQFVHRALVPTWVPPVALALLVALCFGLYSLLARPPEFAGVPTFEPANPQAGQPVTVRWNVRDADTITLRPEGQPAIDGIDPSAGAYTFPDGFANPTKVELIAANRFGSTPAQPLPIGVIALVPTPTPEPGAPVVKSFVVTPAEVALGQPVTLSWEVTDADSVMIDQFGSVDSKGQAQDTPQATVAYRLTAVGKGGKQTVKVQQVVVMNTAATAQIQQAQTAAVGVAQQQTTTAQEAAATAAAALEQTAQAAEQQTAQAIADQTAEALAAQQTVEADQQAAVATQTAVAAATQTAVAQQAAQTANNVRIVFDSLPNGIPVTNGTILHDDEFLSKGILLTGAPETSYCSEATQAAIRQPNTYSGISFYFLTTATKTEINRCNSIPVEIAFTNPIRRVTLTFAGASVIYVLNAYDNQGNLIGTVQQKAVLNGGTSEITYTADSTTIKRIRFGHQAAVTAVKEIYYER